MRAGGLLLLACAAEALSRGNGGSAFATDPSAATATGRPLSCVRGPPRKPLAWGSALGDATSTPPPILSPATMAAPGKGALFPRVEGHNGTNREATFSCSVSFA